MSWLTENYEKALVGGAIAVGLGLGYLGWVGLQSVEEDFSAGLKGRGVNETAVANADLIPKAEQSLGLTHEWTQGRDAQDRPVDLFTGVPLFIKSTAPDKAIDLPNDSAPVHPPIPNIWWIEKRIDPGFANAPQLDPDVDGFNNLEEFEANTDPQNPQSYPPLIHKLRFVKDESLRWVIRPGYGMNGGYPFTYSDGKGAKNRIADAEPVKEGDLFFRSGVQQNRFKLLKSEVRREMNPNTNIEMQTTWLSVEDQLPNKKGKIYELPAPLNVDRQNDFLQFDRTGVFSLEALQREGAEFKVEENTRFALPPDAKEKAYLLKSITPQKVVIEFNGPDGTPHTVEIEKGSLPSKSTP